MINQIQDAIRNSEFGNITFFDPQYFPWVAEVEALWPDIKAECEHLMTAVDLLPGFEEIQTDQQSLSNDKRWKIFPFLAYGFNVPENIRRCPKTAEALSRIPGIKAAMFSVLQAGKVLPWHNGPYNGVLRYHLGVSVPEPEQCGIQVLETANSWVEGKSMIFDDSFQHAAWNLGDKDRIVLFVDFERPGLPPELAHLNNIMINEIGKSDFITSAALKWLEWEKKHGEDLDDVLIVAERMKDLDKAIPFDFNAYK